jgi:hypothetical protein
VFHEQFFGGFAAFGRECGHYLIEGHGAGGGRSGELNVAG